MARWVGQNTIIALGLARWAGQSRIICTRVDQKGGTKVGQMGWPEPYIMH